MHFKQQPWAGFPRQGEIGQMDCLHDLLALLKKMRQLDSELHLIFERVSQLKYSIVTDVKKQEGWKDMQSFQVIALVQAVDYGCQSAEVLELPFASKALLLQT